MYDDDQYNCSLSPASPTYTYPGLPFPRSLVPQEKPRDTLATDVEIIVQTKDDDLFRYAKGLDTELKERSLRTDMIFPHEAVSVNKLVEPITKLPSLFAVLIDSASEKAKVFNLIEFGNKLTRYNNVPYNLAADLILERYREIMKASLSPLPEAIRFNLGKLYVDKLVDKNNVDLTIDYLQGMLKEQIAFKRRKSSNVTEAFEVEEILYNEEGQVCSRQLLPLPFRIRSQ